MDAAVIGGGISGLTAAYELKRRGHRVCVLERQCCAGGNAISERTGGFLMEHGPSSVNGAGCEAAALARTLGLDTLRCPLGAGVRYRYLTRDGRLYRIGTHPLGFVLSDYLSLGGRLRLVAEILVPTKRDDGDESVADFCHRRFGAEFAEGVIDPLLGGLRAARADETSMSACFPALVDMERTYGSVIRAMLARGLAHGTMPGRRLYSWRDGIGTLPWALAQRLGPAVKTGTAVRRIRHVAGGYRIEAGPAVDSILARAVVIATQPHVAAALLEGVDIEAAAAAGAIDAPPLAVVFLGYHRSQIDHPLDGLGYLSPSRERRTSCGTLFNSTMFGGRAPAGYVALTAYIGGARAPDAARLPTADLVALAREEFRELLGASGEPVIARTRQWVRGLPQYRLGHESRLATLLGARDRRPGLFITGNYFSGPSIASCTAQACETAGHADRFLRATVHTPDVGPARVRPAIRGRLALALAPTRRGR